jgi:hypothetical protein
VVVEFRSICDTALGLRVLKQCSPLAVLHIDKMKASYSALTCFACRHLEFILHCHFQSVESLLCVAPYNPVLESMPETATVIERCMVLYSDMHWPCKFNQTVSATHNQ